MLSVFPELLSYWLVAPFFLRFALGVFFIISGIQHSRQKLVLQAVLPQWSKPGLLLLPLVEVVLGIFFIVGLYTQVVALLGVVYAIKVLFLKTVRSPFAAWAPHAAFLYIFILAMTLSLLVLGAGILAFDLPL